MAVGFEVEHRDNVLSHLYRQREIAGEIGKLLAHKNRPAKDRTLSPHDFRELWHAQISAPELAQLRGLTAPISPARSSSITAADALALAEEHLFDRQSVVLEQQLWSHAREYAGGHDVNLEDLKALTASRGYIPQK